MEKKIKILLEIIIIIIAITYYIVKIMMPDLKNMYGSSDRIVNPDKCVNIIEIKIDNNIDFMYLLDSNKKIYHIIFLSKQSQVLYNKNIENQNINDSLKKSIELLIERNYLKNNSSIKVVKYNTNNYTYFKENLINNLNYYGISTNLVEEQSDFTDYAIKHGIDISSKNNMILELDLYSKNNIVQTDNKENEIIILNKETSRKLSNNIYKKIEKYVSNNNIENQEKDDKKIIIMQIPADENATYYPNSNSWYYIQNKKVYAYIEFGDYNKGYGYCYEGTIDDVHEGECEVNEKNKS